MEVWECRVVCEFPQVQTSTNEAWEFVDKHEQFFTLQWDNYEVSSITVSQSVP